MRTIRISTVLLALLLSVTSCFKDAGFEPGLPGEDSRERSLPERKYDESSRRVMVLVSAGYNSLSGYLQQDLMDLEEGYLPQGTGFNTDVLLVLSRQTRSYGDYLTGTAPVLYRLYADNRSGSVQRDTLLRWSDDTQLSKKETLQEALSYVQQKFPAQGYGMVFSSHATGWLPSGYYSDPSPYESKSGRGFRSIGQDMKGTQCVEIELRDFADAIPMHLDYLLMDACLNGCVEVAWALRGKADVVGFSPTEILADGFDYPNITSHLLAPTPDPVAVCREYFEFYDSQSGSNRSATITAVDTRRMDALAEVCSTLFEKYRTAILSLDGNTVQGYFRYDKHFFYDLKDILVQAGITPEEEAQLDAALSACILYQAATPYFLGIPLVRVCGLSMFLPSMGTAFLTQFYKDQMAWNDATHLVN